MSRQRNATCEDSAAEPGELPVVPAANVLFRVGPGVVRDRVLLAEEPTEDVARFGFQNLARLTVDAVTGCVRFADRSGSTPSQQDRRPGSFKRGNSGDHPCPL